VQSNCAQWLCEPLMPHGSRDGNALCSQYLLDGQLAALARTKEQKRGWGWYLCGKLRLGCVVRHIIRLFGCVDQYEVLEILPPLGRNLLLSLSLKFYSALCSHLASVDALEFYPPHVVTASINARTPAAGLTGCLNTNVLATNTRTPASYAAPIVSTSTPAVDPDLAGRVALAYPPRREQPCSDGAVPSNRL
jgi:hypothetical protein